MSETSVSRAIRPVSAMVRVGSLGTSDYGFGGSISAPPPTPVSWMRSKVSNAGAIQLMHSTPGTTAESVTLDPPAGFDIIGLDQWRPGNALGLGPSIEPSSTLTAARASSGGLTGSDSGRHGRMVFR